MNQLANTPGKLKAVLFDLDDTLYDHHYGSLAALATLQSEYPQHFGAIVLEDLGRAHLEILNEVHIGVLNGSLTQDAAREQRWNMLVERFGIVASPEEHAEMRSKHSEAYRSSRRATEGAIPLLRALRDRGLRIAIVSNNLLEEQLGKLAECGLADLIDSLTVSEEVGIAKPDPRIFHIALERIGRSTNEVVMVGDSWTSDIAPALALGMRAIWFNRTSQPAPDSAVPILSSFKNVQQALALILDPNNTSAS